VLSELRAFFISEICEERAMIHVLARNCRIIVVAAILLLLPLAAHAVPQKGKSLPPFEVTAVNGQKIASSSYTGRVLLLAISSDSCSYCKSAIPDINGVHSRYGKQGLAVLGLIYGPGFGLDKLKQYIDLNQVTYPLAVTSQKSVGDTIGAHSVPTYILLNKKGNVAGYYRGYSDRNMQEIEKQVKQLLAE
jgi:peroxiredoxin